MADDLAKMLMQGDAEPYPYGKPRFPNLDPRAYFDRGSQQHYADEPYDPRNISPGLLAGALAATRPGSAASSMRPFNPKAPEAPLPKRPDTSLGDNGLPQHIYEAMLGRTRNPLTPNEPAGSSGGHWLLPKSPLPWIGVGGIGYAGYKGEQKLMDDYGNKIRDGEQPWAPLTWLHQKIGSKPFTPEELAQYNARADAERAHGIAGPEGNLDAWSNERQDAIRLGATQPHWLKDLMGLPLNQQEEAEMAKRRLPGGVGAAPY